MLSEGKSALVGFSITVGCHILCSQKLKIKLTKGWKRKAHSKSSDAAWKGIYLLCYRCVCQDRWMQPLAEEYLKALADGRVVRVKSDRAS